MHECGTVDFHLGEEKGFQWVVDLTKVIAACFKMLIYDLEFGHLFEVCEYLSELGYDINLIFPQFYSKMKFANYVPLVFGAFREGFPALIRTYEESMRKQHSRDKHGVDKAKKIGDVQGKVLTLNFQVHLFGLCDIYDRFGW